MLKDELVQGSVEGVYAKEKRAEKELKESEDKFQTLFNLMPDPIVIVDGKGKFLAVNDRVEEITGFKKKELLGKNFLRINIVTAKSKVILMKNLAKRMMGMQVAPYEVEVLTKDGKKLPFEVNATKIGYEGKQADMGVFREVTERKKVEEALKQSEEKFRNIFESANDCVIYLDRSGRILDVNRKAVQVFGGSKKELLGKHFTKVGIFSPRDIPKLMASFAKGLAGKKATLNLCIKNKKGQEMHLECSASPMKINDKIVGRLVVARDVTERKKMEEKLKEYMEKLEEKVEERTRELKESEEKYRSLFENANDVIVHVNLTGKILDINRKVEEIVGRKKEEIVGKNFVRLGLVSLKNVPKLLSFLRRKVEDKTSTRLELAITGKGGEKRFEEVNAIRVPKGVLAVVRDITQRKKAEQRLLKSERLAAIGEVATMVGHDLRNPLQSIENAIYYLKNELPRLSPSIPIPKKRWKCSKSSTIQSTTLTG